MAGGMNSWEDASLHRAGTSDAILTRRAPPGHRRTADAPSDAVASDAASSDAAPGAQTPGHGAEPRCQHGELFGVQNVDEDLPDERHMAGSRAAQLFPALGSEGGEDSADIGGTGAAPHQA